MRQAILGNSPSMPRPGGSCLLVPGKGGWSTLWLAGALPFRTVSRTEKERPMKAWVPGDQNDASSFGTASTGGAPPDAGLTWKVAYLRCNSAAGGHVPVTG